MKSIEKEVLESMKRMLQKIEDKLQDENILGDVNETARLQNKKVWVVQKIKEWQQFINQ